MKIIASKGTITITFSAIFSLHECFKVLEVEKKNPDLQVNSNNFGQNFFNKDSHH